jgi:hypothetical protein
MDKAIQLSPELSRTSCLEKIFGLILILFDSFFAFSIVFLLFIHNYVALIFLSMTYPIPGPWLEKSEQPARSIENSKVHLVLSAVPPLALTRPNAL